MSLSKTQQLETYRRMQRIRQFEEAIRPQMEEGHIPGVCHTSSGQEAAIVGACMALRDDDKMTGTHRSHGHPIGKGAKLDGLMAELMGRTNGICKGRGGSMHLADSSVGIVGESSIVGGGIPLATGCGLSAHVRGTDQVSLCFFGDGASNQGTFHESINMAAVWKLPVIYFCENNLYALTTAVSLSHGQPDIARRAEGYGIPGVIVDGQDATAVYAATRTAVDRARRGDGPTLIEAKTYRFDEHEAGLHVAGSPYRPKEEVEHYKNNRDPLVLYKHELLSKGFTDKELEAIESEVKEAVDQAVAFGLSGPLPKPEDVYDFMYSHPIHYPPVKATV